MERYVYISIDLFFVFCFSLFLDGNNNIFTIYIHRVLNEEDGTVDKILQNKTFRFIPAAFMETEKQKSIEMQQELLKEQQESSQIRKDMQEYKAMASANSERVAQLEQQLAQKQAARKAAEEQVEKLQKINKEQDEIIKALQQELLSKKAQAQDMSIVLQEKSQQCLELLEMVEQKKQQEEQIQAYVQEQHALFEQLDQQNELKIQELNQSVQQLQAQVSQQLSQISMIEAEKQLYANKSQQTEQNQQGLLDEYRIKLLAAQQAIDQHVLQQQKDAEQIAKLTQEVAIFAEKNTAPQQDKTFGQALKKLPSFIKGTPPAATTPAAHTAPKDAQQTVTDFRSVLRRGSVLHPQTEKPIEKTPEKQIDFRSVLKKTPTTTTNQ